MKFLLRLLPLVLLALAFGSLRADDGYRLWLRYDLIANAEVRARYTRELAIIGFETPAGAESPTIAAARDELKNGLHQLLGQEPVITLAGQGPPDDGGGFTLQSTSERGRISTIISAGTDLGVLYGAFDLLRRVQMGEPLENLKIHRAPKIQRRLLNHWDNLDRKVERGYAGFSLWEWFYLPDYINPRYRDYARACASIGINGTVLNNVNSDPLILTPAYLEKVAALANVFRPYGIRVYLSVRFSSPIEIGGLATADPLDPAVAAWWKAKAGEVYRSIPDFGGFLVKANSEGEPGPQDYHRTHAAGANVLADALAPHDGVVIWRAFVYAAENPDDRVKQAYAEFAPLDGKFRDNVVVQIKNGPLDFMPREPFSPLFGAMPKTALAAELQITQEYLGQSVQLAYLAPLWKEALDASTVGPGQASTVAQIVEGRGHPRSLSVIAGVANIGTDRDWTGHPLAQSNWYAYGRLAWDPDLTSETIADEWTKMTFRTDAATTAAIEKILLGSRETVVNYSMPLGLHHIMAEGSHYGPGPWVTGLKRRDWESTYYHRADALGLGFERTAAGSNALAQYAPAWQRWWDDLATCPDEYLLWFHHVPWDYKMRSGRILWDELCLRYERGVNEVRAMQRTWDTLGGAIDPELHAHVKMLMTRQEKDAVIWRDACLLYFQTFSRRPLPAGVEAPAHPLEYYESIKQDHMPGH